MSNAQMYADQAVYQLQLRSSDAIKYICKNAGVDLDTATTALKSVLLFHRQK